MADAGMRLQAPATARNREPILEVLRRVLPERGTVLEIASGTGEHALFFARALPGVTWQPSDVGPEALASIAAWREHEGSPNLLAPLALDVCAPTWSTLPFDQVDAVININMIHIAPWAACERLMAGAARLLPVGGALVMYGPYQVRGVNTAPSNLAFDRSLRARDPAWGLRWLHEVEAAAADRGLALQETVAMPANNLIAVYRKAQPERG